MNIRPADLEQDALAIIDGAKDFVSRVNFTHLLPQDDVDFVRVVGSILTAPGMETLVCDHDGEIVAGIGILYIPFQWNPEILVADERFWWTARNAPFGTAVRLFKVAMAEIKKKNAIPVFRTLQTTPDGVDRLYKRMGLCPLETVYVGTN